MDEKNKKILRIVIITAICIVAVSAIIVGIALALNSGKKTNETSAVNKTAASQTELSKTESSQSEPSKTESSLPEPSKTESSLPEPSKTESSQSEPSKTESSQSEPSKAESSQSEPSKSEPSQPEPSKTEPSQPEPSSESYREVVINDQIYYQRLNGNTWSGDYQSNEFDMYQDNYVEKFEVVSYEDYLKIIEEVNNSIGDDKEHVTASYNDETSNYIIMADASNHSWCKFDLIDVVEAEIQIIVYGYESTYGVMASGSGYFVAVPTKMPVGTVLSFRQCYSKEEIQNIRKYGTIYDPNNIVVDKPVIYLYPTEETKISVKLLKDKNITCSYPKYKDGWEVIAKPDGTLTDTETGRELYSLYYEARNSVDFSNIKDGFVVKGEDSAAFLEEKLAVLGLTEREAEEFIIYWLPRLEANEYNLIRFATEEEINENMPLDIDPSPDSMIRVIMVFKALDEPVNIPEQKLSTPERTGFTLVEWGGTEIK